MTGCLLKGHVDVSLHIWDTGGNALASPMLNSYLHEAHVRIREACQINFSLKIVKKLYSSFKKLPVTFIHYCIVRILSSLGSRVSL